MHLPQPANNAARYLLSAAFFLSLMLGSDFTIGQELDPQQKEWVEHYAKQKNAPKPGEMLLNTDEEPDLSEGYTSLFNGKDLTGWTPKGGT